MKITIGRNPNEDFHVYDKDGNEITDKLQVKDLSFDVNSRGGATVVHMTCYVDCIEVLTDQLEVTIIDE